MAPRSPGNPPTPRRDSRVDAYIARAEPFARPVLRRLRALVHRGCPSAVETIKWGFPHFEHHGILCSMAAFRAHCTFGFWKEKLLNAPEGVFAARGAAMGSLGRITSLRDLPSDSVLLRLIRQAAALNGEGLRPSGAGRASRTAGTPVAPPWFLAALRKRPAALRTFTGFSPSRRRDYVEWVTEARREETRRKRVPLAVEWLEEGKSRNWRYERPRKDRKS